MIVKEAGMSLYMYGAYISMIHVVAENHSLISSVPTLTIVCLLHWSSDRIGWFIFKFGYDEQNVHYLT